MNEIEKMFWNAYLDYWGITEDDECCILKPHVQIDVYKVDFLHGDDLVVEIDGHEYHKTKEQRFKDYQRERYLMKRGYTVVRFMATEVFLAPSQCVEDMLEVSDTLDQKNSVYFYEGLKAGREGK